MKFDWNQDKNRWLKEKRKISFEEIICLSCSIVSVVTFTAISKTPYNIAASSTPSIALTLFRTSCIDAGTVFMKTNAVGTKTSS